MQTAGPHHEQPVVGGGRVTADPGIDLISESWLHSVFQCPLHNDPCVGVTEFARTSNLVQSGISVPGSAHGDRRVCRARPCLLLLLRQWYEVMWRLRRAGFTLRGNFSRDNFIVYRPKLRQAQNQLRGPADRRRAAEDRLEVRMTGRLHLSRYSPEDAVEDDRTFVWSVRELLPQLPLEIGDWLNLINCRGVGNEYLVRYHISLMDPRAGFSVLMSFRRRIDYLMRRRPEVYASIVSMMSLFQDWNSLVFQFTNSHMEAARQHILKQSGRSQQDGFDPNVRGILKVIRDCSEHPARRFEEFMLLILEEEFHAFATLLHFVMFRTGQLRFFHLENTMG